MRYLFIIFFLLFSIVYAQKYSSSILNNTEWEVNNWFGDDTVMMTPIKFPTDTTLKGERRARQQASYWTAYKIEFNNIGECDGINSTSFLRMDYSWGLEKFKLVNDRVEIVLVKYQLDYLAGATMQTFNYQVVRWTPEKIVLTHGN